MKAALNPEGVYIVFEGPDGGGKGTQTRLLVAGLEKNFTERKILAVREPGGTAVSEEIRETILRIRSSDRQISDRCEFLLFSAARAQLIEQVIKPAVEKGSIVVAERSYISSLVYQGALGLDTEEMLAISKFATNGFFPHKVFLCDVPVETTRCRISVRGEADEIESRAVEYKEMVRNNYLQFAKTDPDMVTVIDGRGLVGSIQNEILASVADFLLETNRIDSVKHLQLRQRVG